MKATATIVLTASVLGGALALHGYTHRNPTLPHPARLTGSAPPVMLWAWEEPEDLRTLDSQRAGVAFLAERVFLGRTATVILRHQPLLLPQNPYVVAVVRIETEAPFADTPELRTQTAAAILRVASLPDIRGLQVDFDATSSQHAFYADILHRVRTQLPSRIDLTMTALVSWCAQSNGFLHNLPVDAVVPMYFRLGQHVGTWGVREPLCNANLGLSIDELRSAPVALPSGQRLYLFAPRPWTSDQLAVINRNQIPIAAPGAR